MNKQDGNLNTLNVLEKVNNIIEDLNSVSLEYSIRLSSCGFSNECLNVIAEKIRLFEKSSIKLREKLALLVSEEVSRNNEFSIDEFINIIDLSDNEKNNSDKLKSELLDYSIKIKNFKEKIKNFKCSDPQEYINSLTSEIIEIIDVFTKDFEKLSTIIII